MSSQNRVDPFQIRPESGLGGRWPVRWCPGTNVEGGTRFWPSGFRVYAILAIALNQMLQQQVYDPTNDQKFQRSSEFQSFVISAFSALGTRECSSHFTSWYTLGTREDSVISAFGTLGTREDSVIPAHGTLGNSED